MTKRETPYNGPPGDDRVYMLPRDRDDLDTAWDAYYAAHPELEPQPEPEQEPAEIPF